MAQTKLFAPEGFHFMITPSKGFYIMKNPVSGYEKHVLPDGTYSSTFVLIDYPVNHKKVADVFHYTTLTEARSYKTKKAKKSVKVISADPPTPTSDRVVRTVRVSSTANTSRRRGGGSSSGSSSGGGY